MSIPILKEKILLRPDDFEPVDQNCEVIGSFNPGAARYKDEIILLVRVVERPKSEDPDKLVSPRAVWKNDLPKWEFDYLDASGADISDPRLIRMPDRRIRLRYISYLRLVRLSSDGTHVKEILSPAALLPTEPWEEFGIEDPRITKIGDLYYITYVAISPQMGVATALMTTKDFQTFDRHGIIFPTENKDVVLLPEKVNGQFVAYHRPVSHHWVDVPSIEGALSPDAIYWGKHHFLFGPRKNTWESVKVGAGAPPVRVPQGWLLIYHGVSPATPQSPGGKYSAGAALLDYQDPFRVIARSETPLLSPERSYEREGFLPNVIFPTGTLISEDGESLLIFSGAADEVVAFLDIPIKSIMEHLQ